MKIIAGSVHLFGLMSALALGGCISPGSDQRDIWTAAADGNVPRLRQLMDQGWDVNATNPAPEFKDMTPLHFAAAGGHADAVKLLLAQGADPNRVSHWGFSPLHMVWSDMAAYPLDTVDVEKKLILKGRCSVGKLLLEAGADVNAQDRNGWSPLHTAALCGDVALCELYLRSGAAVGAAYFGQTPLHWAAFMGRKSTMALLLRHGAAIDAFDENGFSALHYAVERNNLDVAKYLLDEGAEVNAAGPPNRTTPLLLSAVMHQESMSRLLRSRGADPTLCNECGENPLTVARYSGSEQSERRRR